MDKITNIRDEIYTLIIATAAFSSSNTFKGRYEGKAIESADLPTASIYFDSLSQEPVSIGTNRTFEGEADFTIVINSKGTGYDNTDESLDAYCEQIRGQLTDRTLSGTTLDAYMTSIEYNFNNVGESLLGSATISIKAIYTIKET